MGAWGVGYKDNDNFFNEVSGFVSPTVQALSDGLINPQYDFSDIRAYAVVVHQMLSAVESIQLSEEDINQLRIVIQAVLDRAKNDASIWNDPQEFLDSVEFDMKAFTEWLDGFAQTGLLQDRLGFIMEAMEEKLPEEPKPDSE